MLSKARTVFVLGYNLCCLGEGRHLQVSWQAFVGTGLYQPLRVENMICRAQDGLESV